MPSTSVGTVSNTHFTLRAPAVMWCACCCAVLRNSCCAEGWQRWKDVRMAHLCCLDGGWVHLLSVPVLILVLFQNGFPDCLDC